MSSLTPCPPVCLRSPTTQRRARMRAVWRAYREGRPYLLEARACRAEAVSCRPEDRNATTKP